MIKIKTRQAVSNIQWPDTVHPLLQRIYSARHVEQIDDIELSLKKLLPPDRLAGLEDAVSLLV
ncbi:MAG: single-stranded-DNA-specific exonuclease RecJ, partial [Gammaproteobacteria bacterium]|nr:single-stranded-DNA-specific exonuclease RecJ [Gammaproteobacteria bacterium]